MFHLERMRDDNCAFNCVFFWSLINHSYDYALLIVPTRADAALKPAVYLDQDVQDFFIKLAAKKGVEMSVIINDVLKKTIALLDVVR